MTVHRPGSALPYSMNELATTSFMSLGPVFAIDPAKQSTHTARTLKALDFYGDFLAIACAREKHSVFSCCITAQMATIQISACQSLLGRDLHSLGRDRLRLFIGYLSTMGKYWPLASKMVIEVKTVARIAFNHIGESIHSIATDDIDAGAERAPCLESNLEFTQTEDCLGIAIPAD